MRKIKIYLDTSVWNFVYAGDVPEKRDITIQFFNQIDRYDVFISDVVVEDWLVK